MSNHSIFVRQLYSRLRLFPQSGSTLIIYVYGFYNQNRRHSTLGNLSPAQFENEFYAHEKLSLHSVH